MPPCAQGVRAPGAAPPGRVPARAPACAASRRTSASPSPRPGRSSRAPPLRATPNVSGTAAAATTELPALLMPWCIENVEELAEEYRTAPKAHHDDDLDLAALLAVPEAPKPVVVVSAAAEAAAPEAVAPAAPAAAVTAPASASASAPAEAVVPAASAPPVALPDRGVLLRARVRWTEPFEEGKRVTLWGSWDGWAKARTLARGRIPAAAISMRATLFLAAPVGFPFAKRRAAAPLPRRAAAVRRGQG
jgi:hypothetical protein